MEEESEEERIKWINGAIKRVEEFIRTIGTSKAVEDKQPKVESELNDVVKQLHELKKKLDEISKQLPLVKESTPQAVQTMGEKVYTSTPPQIVQTTPQTISPAEKPEKPPSSLVSPPSPPPEYETPYNLYKKLSSNKEIGLEDIQEYDKVLHSILSDVAEHKVNETILTKYIEWERKERGDPKQYLPLIDAAWKYGIKLNPAEEELVRKWNKKTPKVHIEGEIKLFEE